MAGHCAALSPIAAIVPNTTTTRWSVDQDVDDQGHKEEHVDEASLKPEDGFKNNVGKLPYFLTNLLHWDCGKHVRIFEISRAVSTVAEAVPLIHSIFNCF